MLEYTFGLSSDEAEARRIKSEGFGVKTFYKKPLAVIFAENSFTLFNVINFVIVLFVLVYYVSTDDVRLFYDIIGIVLVTLFNTSVAIYQDYRTHRALEKAKLLAKNEVTVVRDRILRTIDADELVEDDIVKIQRGDQIPADGIVVKSTYLEMDESLLTGESDTVSKKRGDKVFSGSFCRYGGGFYQVTTAGRDSLVSKITATARKFKINASHLTKQINLLFGAFFAVTVLIIAAELAFNLTNGGIDNEDVRKISAIAISLIPEGLVFYSTISFITGLVRMSNRGFVIQRMNAVDAFSSVSVMCLDKTGTLTDNKIVPDKTIRLSDRHNTACLQKITTAFAKLSSFSNNVTEALFDRLYDTNPRKIFEVPFDSARKFSYIEFESENKPFSIILGAYEALADRIDSDKKAETERVFRAADTGLRKSLLLAEVTECRNRDNPHLFEPLNIVPLCLLTFRERLREGVSGIIGRFRKLNIDIKVLSGDGKGAVAAAARNSGIADDGARAHSGEELRLMSEEELAKTVLADSLFYSLSPDDKVMIIKTLKKAKNDVCMTGDGVNDLPAIKEANLGIAMESSSSITKNAADLILKDDNFGLLPDVFNEGLKIVNSVKVISNLLLTKNFVFIFLTLFSWLNLMSFTLSPRSSALLNVFAVGFPSYLISIFDVNTRRIKDILMPSLRFSAFSGVVISALVLGFSLWAGERDFMAPMVNFTIIFICIANFLNAAAFENPPEAKKYLYFTLGLYTAYVLLNAAGNTNFVFTAVSVFYEIEQIPAGDFLLTAGYAAAASAVLWGAQRAVRRFVR